MPNQQNKLLISTFLIITIATLRFRLPSNLNPSSEPNSINGRIDLQIDELPKSSVSVSPNGLVLAVSEQKHPFAGYFASKLIALAAQSLHKRQISDKLPEAIDSASEYQRFLEVYLNAHKFGFAELLKTYFSTSNEIFNVNAIACAEDNEGDLNFFDPDNDYTTTLWKKELDAVVKQRTLSTKTAALIDQIFENTETIEAETQQIDKVKSEYEKELLLSNQNVDLDDGLTTKAAETLNALEPSFGSAERTVRAAGSSIASAYLLRQSGEPNSDRLFVYWAGKVGVALFAPVLSASGASFLPVYKNFRYSYSNHQPIKLDKWTYNGPKETTVGFETALREDTSHVSFGIQALNVQKNYALVLASEAVFNILPLSLVSHILTQGAIRLQDGDADRLRVEMDTLLKDTLLPYLSATTLIKPGESIDNFQKLKNPLLFNNEEADLLDATESSGEAGSFEKCSMAEIFYVKRFNSGLNIGEQSLLSPCVSRVIMRAAKTQQDKPQDGLAKNFFAPAVSSLLVDAAKVLRYFRQFIELHNEIFQALNQLNKLYIIERNAIQAEYQAESNERGAKTAYTEYYDANFKPAKGLAPSQSRVNQVYDSSKNQKTLIGGHSGVYGGDKTQIGAQIQAREIVKNVAQEKTNHLASLNQKKENAEKEHAKAIEEAERAKKELITCQNDVSAKIANWQNSVSTNQKAAKKNNESRFWDIAFQLAVALKLAHQNIKSYLVEVPVEYQRLRLLTPEALRRALAASNISEAKHELTDSIWRNGELSAATSVLELHNKGEDVETGKLAEEQYQSELDLFTTRTIGTLKSWYSEKLSKIRI